MIAGNGEMIVVTLLTGIGMLKFVHWYPFAGAGVAPVRDAQRAAMSTTDDNMISSNRTARLVVNTISGDSGPSQTHI